MATAWDDLLRLDAFLNEKDAFRNTRHKAGLYSRDEIDLYNSIYRFGRLDPYNTLTNTKEYLFFVKPDLHIIKMDNDHKKVYGKTLNDGIKGHPFFEELYTKYPHIIYQLQSSADPTKNPLSYLLTNTVISNLDMPGLDSDTIDNPSNLFGTAYDYRTSSEKSDDNFSFSLEFKDTMHLDVYHFFKAYEEYETLKAHGQVYPMMKYVSDKVLHDNIGIYKIMVDSDMSTIIYYAYFCGVMFTSLPRDAFNNPDFTEGVSFTVNMKAAFVEDMNPLILYDLNNLVKPYIEANQLLYKAPIYDEKLGGVSGMPAAAPYIDLSGEEDISGRPRYKLNWAVKSNGTTTTSSTVLDSIENTNNVTATGVIGGAGIISGIIPSIL